MIPYVSIGSEMLDKAVSLHFQAFPARWGWQTATSKQINQLHFTVSAKRKIKQVAHIESNSDSESKERTVSWIVRGREDPVRPWTAQRRSSLAEGTKGLQEDTEVSV